MNLEMAVWQKLAAHWLLVEEYNKKFNLTAITDTEEAAIKHYLDCLLVLPLVQSLAANNSQLKAVDIGSGAGFPGLVLAIAHPQSQWLLLESVNKKCAFLELCIEKLNITNAWAKPLRAEDAGQRGEWRASHDLVLARAVSALPVLLEYAAPLLKEGGIFAAMKGPSFVEEQIIAGPAQKILGMKLLRQEKFTLPGGEIRYIAAYQKTAPTPSKYPRRAGVPEKKPLGGGGDAPGA